MYIFNKILLTSKVLLIIFFIFIIFIFYKKYKEYQNYEENTDEENTIIQTDVNEMEEELEILKKYKN